MVQKTNISTINQSAAKLILLCNIILEGSTTRK